MAESELKPGVETTEYKAAQSGSAWGVVTIVLGVLMAVGSAVLQAFGSDTKIGIVAGAILGVVGITSKCLVDLGYIKSRTDVKVAASDSSAKPY